MRVIFVAAVLGLAAAAGAYEPPVGFAKTGQVFSGSAIAFAPDGKVAVGSDNGAGGASISVYASLAAVGGAPVRVFAEPAWKFIAGIEFASNDSLVFGENGGAKTVLRGTVSDGSVVALAPNGSVPNVNDLAVSGLNVLAVEANGPSANSLVSIPLAGGAASTVIGGFGNGYGGGVAVRGGEVLLTDSNDPAFTDHAGQVLRYSAAFAPLGAIDLSGGGGSGAVDLTVDPQGDLIVSTGSTLTQIAAGDGSVHPFGTFDAFSFPTFLAWGGDVLLVSGFTDETGYAPGVFGVTPIPEPAGVAIVAAMGLLLARRRR
jgi:hypothetical protein